MKNKRSRIHLTPSPRLKVTLRQLTFAVSFLVVVTGAVVFLFNFSVPKEARAGTETLPSGSFIVNMGVTPQTYNNGLKPYGLVYDLITNYSVPVKWIIETTKVKDGTDFTYNAVAYKGGPFIISADYISSAVTSRI